MRRIKAGIAGLAVVGGLLMTTTGAIGAVMAPRGYLAPGLPGPVAAVQTNTAAPGTPAVTATDMMAGQAVLTGQEMTLPSGDLVMQAQVTARGSTSKIGAFTWTSQHLIDFNSPEIGNGTFTVTDSRGAEFFGLYNGEYASDGTFQLFYTITGGTGVYAGYTGSGTITGTAHGTAFTATIQ